MKKLLTNKLAITAAASLGSVAAFAEGATAPTAETTPGQIAALFTPWISGAAGALVTLLTAGVAIVGMMYVWRLLKRAFGSSK